MDQFSRKTNSAAVLPRGWEVAYTSNSVRYFIDHNTKQTYWTLPDAVLHPEPLPDYESDEETTASSVISYLSHKSLSAGFSSLSFRRRRPETGAEPAEDKAAPLLQSIGKSVRQLFGLTKNASPDCESPREGEEKELAELEGGRGGRRNQQSLSSTALLCQQLDEDEAEVTEEKAKDEEGKSGDSDEQEEEEAKEIERPKSLYLRRLPNSSETVNLSLRTIPTHDDTDVSVASSVSPSVPAVLTPSSSSSVVVRANDFPVLRLTELSPSARSQGRSQFFRGRRPPTLIRETEETVIETAESDRDRGRADSGTGTCTESETGTETGMRIEEPSSTSDVLSFVYGESQNTSREDHREDEGATAVTAAAGVGQSSPLPSPSSASEGKMSISSNAPLPPGWEQCQTVTGRLFYINHNNRTTHWSLPVDQQTL
jgi:hypothetical protein